MSRKHFYDGHDLGEAVQIGEVEKDEGVANFESHLFLP